MIRSLTITPSHALYSRLFCAKGNADLSLEFKPGVNVLSGPNGHGKSTLLRILENGLVRPNSEVVVRAENSSSGGVFFFSMKELEPKHQITHTPTTDPHHHDKLVRAMGLLRLSHGQFAQEILEDLKALSEQVKGAVFIIDEPELGLDAEKIAVFCNFLNAQHKNKRKNQFIVVSHHPFILLNKKLHHIEMDPSVEYLNKVTSSARAFFFN